MPGDVVVRRLRQDDADGVRALDSEILGDERSVTWDQYVERYLAVSQLESLILPPWGAHVAEVDGRLAGFLFAERQTSNYGLPPGARIVAVAVRPGMRRRGIGGLLVEALVEECRAEGIEEIYSVLRTEDARDRAFLVAAGFGQASVQVLSRRV